MRGLGLLLCSLALGACAPTQANLRKADAQLAILCPVAGARVYVDESFVGRASELERRALPVLSGTRRVEVRADGYFTAYREVTVPAGGRAQLVVALRKVPDNEPGG